MRRIPSVSDGSDLGNRDYAVSGPSVSYSKPTSPPEQRYRPGPVGVGTNRAAPIPNDQAGPYSVTDRAGRAQSVRSMVAIYDYDPHVLSPNADAEVSPVQLFPDLNQIA